MRYKSLIAAAIVAAPLFVASPSHAATPVDLGAAGDFAILAKSGITTTGVTSVVGNMGISPAQASAITGFGLVLPAGSAFSTSSLVNGKVYAPGYAPPTPANLITAVSDMEAAYDDAAGRPAGVTELGAGTLTGLTLVPGVYSWSSAVTIPTNLTLSGGPTGVWIFQIAGTLTTAADTQIILSGGAQARHVYWQVAGATSLGARSQFKGIILDATAVSMGSGARVDGRLLAQTAVTLIANTINSGSVAQLDSQLVDGFFFVESSDDPDNNTCGVGISGGQAAVYGDVRGMGTGGEEVLISYNAPQPTSSSRSDTMISVAQNKFSTIDIRFDGVSATNGPVAVEKCSIKGLADISKLTGSVSQNCKSFMLNMFLSPADVASIETAFASNKNVKVKANSDSTIGSISIKCRGDALSE